LQQLCNSEETKDSIADIKQPRRAKNDPPPMLDKPGACEHEDVCRKYLGAKNPLKRASTSHRW